MIRQPTVMQCLKKHRLSHASWLPLWVLIYFLAQTALAENNDTSRQALENLLASRRHPLLLQQDFSRQHQALTQLYGMNANRLLWLGESDSEKNRLDALALLRNAAADGLNPQHYDAESLSRYLQQAASQPETSRQDLAAYDLALSIALLRFIHDLHAGQFNPRDVGYPAPFGSKPTLDSAALLMQHRNQQTLLQLPQTAAPQIQQYRQLKQALAKLRQQADTGLPGDGLHFTGTLHPGDNYSQMPELRQRLQALGYLSEDEINAVAETDRGRYDPATVTAIQGLQQAQGLISDGIIGKRTQTILNQSPNEKIALIALAMERLRWLPELPGGPLIIVNIPAFRLWAYHSLDEASPLNMKVVVGKAAKNQTPMLWEKMQYLEFMPYWNIPSSIMTKEILPKVLRNGDYLSDEDIELVSRTGNDDADDIGGLIDDIKRGRVRGRQRPGDRNPLGKVKFIFPNQDDVYLHDTPSRNAFKRDRRDLSHGCVRVEEAENLAAFVLDDQSGWNKESIEAAMQGSKTRRVTLQNPIPVLFFYNTAFVDSDGKAHFYPDIYGQDSQLLDLINRLPATGEHPLLIGNNSLAVN